MGNCPKLSTVTDNTPSTNDTLLHRIIGPSVETGVTVCGTGARGLIDSGSAVTTMAEWFYYSLINKPVLHSLQDLGLVRQL